VGAPRRPTAAKGSPQLLRALGEDPSCEDKDHVDVLVQMLLWSRGIKTVDASARCLFDTAAPKRDQPQNKLCEMLRGFCNHKDHGEKVRSVCCGTCSKPCVDNDEEVMKVANVSTVGQDFTSCGTLKGAGLCTAARGVCCSTCSKPAQCPCEEGRYSTEDDCALFSAGE